MVSPEAQKDILLVSRISAVPSILKVVAELTGMRVTMVARVTRNEWTACAAYDRMGFGLEVGTQLEVTTTLCKEVCDSNKSIVIQHASLDPIYHNHRTPKHYNIESYIAIPILFPNGDMFGTLCAIDREPAIIDEKIVTSLTLFAELISSQLRVEQEHLVIEQHAQELELKVVERTLRLQETVEELETLSYTISHNMRAPLRAMKSFGSLLKEKTGESIDIESRDYLRRIIHSVERMDNLVEDVLVLSHVARSEIPLNKVELLALLNGLLESYPQFDRADAKIEISLPIPAVVGNAALLLQCFSNLIDNAIKFARAGEKPEIKIWAETRGEAVRINIKDNGRGIAPDFHARIFEIFYRHDHKVAGTGIGLAVVKKAVERMGGTVGVDSQGTDGSTFYLEIKRSL